MMILSSSSSRVGEEIPWLVSALCVFEQRADPAFQLGAQRFQGRGVYPRHLGLAHEFVDRLARDPGTFGDVVPGQSPLFGPLLQLPSNRHAVNVPLTKAIDNSKCSAYYT